MAENYFRLTSLEDGNQISIKAVGSPTAVNLQYRTNAAQTWHAYAIGTLISISTNEWIEFRNDTGTFSSGNESTWEDYYNVTMTKAADASGSIMSLLDYNNMDMAVPRWAFYGLFRYCSTLRNPPELPATTLADYCYFAMFEECTSLTTAPELPATTVAISCYANMFFRCYSLTQAPELPATTLADYCYANMFDHCSSLTQAPALPATTLADYCYSEMFYTCSRLTKAPQLAASTLTQYCYANMFSGCYSLTQAPALSATILANYCYSGMFKLCANLNHIIWKSTQIPSSTYCEDWLSFVSDSGTFEYTDPTLDVASITRNNSGVPAGWSISLLSPETKLLLKINNSSVDNISLFGKKIASLSINGKPVKS